MQAADFTDRWQKLSNPELQQQEVFQAGAPITAESVAAAKAKIIDRMHLAVAAGVDTTPFTMSGAAFFRTGTAGPTGEKLAVGCLVRIEANAAGGAYRVTARASNAMVARGALRVAKAQLA